jgi:hypothetical protein
MSVQLFIRDVNNFAITDLKQELPNSKAVLEIIAIEERLKKLRQALKEIIEIGKRDLSNTKYDSYFESAKQILEGEKNE